MASSTQNPSISSSTTMARDRYAEMFLFPYGYNYRCYCIPSRVLPRSSVKTYVHNIFINADTNALTVDGKDYGKTDDPQNASFIECLLNADLPDEFEEEGFHDIRIEPITEEELAIRPGELGPMVNYYSDSDSD
ncbi:hypothetical protein ACHQM5_022267 [Ranunculus cassubicifolius]